MSDVDDELSSAEERGLRAWWISNGGKWSWVVASAFRAWQKDPSGLNEKTRALFERYASEYGFS